MNLQRRGRFSVDIRLLDPDSYACRAVFDRVIVVRAEMIYAENRIDYTAISPLFDVIQLGETTPKYDITITRTEPLGQLVARFERSAE